MFRCELCFVDLILFVARLLVCLRVCLGLVVLLGFAASGYLLQLLGTDCNWFVGMLCL